MHNILKDANSKLARVVAELFGASGRRMPAAFMAGEREPNVMAAFAQGRLRRKLSPLELALTGPLPPHHARLMQGLWSALIHWTGT